MEISKSYGTSDFDDQNRKGGTVAKPEPIADTDNKLDSQESTNLLNKLKTWYAREMEVQAPNRYQMMLDCDYYDSMQWSQEEAEVLMARKQAPMVFNEIKNTVDWMIGTERFIVPAT